jgi:hypothetical protein
MTNVTIGSISTGTLRIEDLLDAFAGELSRLTNDTHKLLKDYATVDADDWSQGSELVNELQEALNEHAPPHVYFGSLEGDGADFGFWPTQEPFSDTCATHITHEPAGPLNQNTELIDLDCNVYVSVNDHGNITVSKVVCDGENHRANGTNLCHVDVCLIAGNEIWSAV